VTRPCPKCREEQEELCEKHTHGIVGYAVAALLVAVWFYFFVSVIADNRIAAHEASKIQGPPVEESK
jgi:hypothetical protein